MNKPRKWATEIKAWADGSDIQGRCEGIGAVWENLISPNFSLLGWEFRLKPKEPRVETGIFVHGDDIRDLRDVSYKLTIDPVTDRVISLELVK